jgi:tripartite-type tricarboxylate transporter receptor subunit TctC
VTSRQRSTVAPEIPTIAESGLAGYEATTWYGILAPAGTSRAIVDALQQHTAEIVKQGDVREKLLAQGLEPVGNKPAEFGSIITAELVKWSKVVAAAGVKAE